MLAPLLVVIALGINLPQYVQNYQLTGSPVGVPVPSDSRPLPFANDRISLSVTVSNVLRHASLELAVPSTKINLLTAGAVSAAIHAIGADPNDPGTTWPDEHWFHGYQLPWDIRSEVLTSNPLHFLILLGVGLLLGTDRGRRYPRASAVLLGVAGAFVLYSTMLRWQIFSSRQFISLLIASAPLVGLVLARMSPRVGSVVAALLFVCGFAFAADNELRPLLPWPAPSIFGAERSQLYFADDEQQYAQPWMAAADLVKSAGCTDVAIDPAGHLLVYPMMALLHNDGVQETRFAGVTNHTVAYSDGSVDNACAVVCLECASTPETAQLYTRDGWRRSHFGDTLVFTRT